jgi:phytol kinase
VAPFFTEAWLDELPIVMLAFGAVFAGLWVANIVFDLGVPNYISRKIGHGAGGFAFFACSLLSAPGWPIIGCACFAALLMGARVLRPSAFRGVGGTGRSQTVMAEVWFPLVAVPVLAVGWFWLDQAKVAVASLLFMAWGDGATGIVRSQVYGRPVKGWWGSLAMLAICVVISLVLIRPVWIGAAAAVAAVIAERVFGDCGPVKWHDDNLAIPVVSLGTALGLLALTGNL